MLHYEKTQKMVKRENRRTKWSVANQQDGSSIFKKPYTYLLVYLKNSKNSSVMRKSFFYYFSSVNKLNHLL